MKSSKAARVIFPNGEIRQFRELVKAAELMLESPSFFVVNTRSLHIGRRFSALGADEDLEFGNVYIMFPMRRVNSIITAADMAVFFMTANSVTKRISTSKVRTLPEVAVGTEAVSVDSWPENESGQSRLSFEEVGGFPITEFHYRSAMCRSRKPMLDTITEEPVCSR